SFSIEPGEFFAMLGPNGAGKTTTISILTTTLAPTSGLVRVGNHDVSREASEVRRDVGIIFQRPSLDLNLTAEENVRLHTFLYGLSPFRPSFRLMPITYRDQVREQADRVCVIDHGHIVAQGTPAELKSQLIEDYLLVDAADRAALIADLIRLGVQVKEDRGLVRIDAAGERVHQILKAIDTPLSVV